MTTAKEKMDGGETLQPKQGYLRAVVDGDRVEFSSLDSFLIRIGAKSMPSTAKTNPIEWNKSVLGLVATLITVLSVFAVVLWNYATLSANFQNYQKVNDDKVMRMEADMKDLKGEIQRFKEFQLKTDAYKLGALDAHGDKPKEK